MELPELDSWQQLRARMAGSLRSQAWRDAGRWALDCAERHLGHRWLAQHHERGLPAPAEFTRSSYDLEAFAHLLELALRLELLQEAIGFGAVRRMLKRDLRPESWRHPLIQLEVASLAQRLGKPCGLERGRSGSSGSPADIVLGSPGQETVAEVKVVHFDDAAAASGREDFQIGEEMNRLSFTYEVVFGGRMTERLDQDQRVQWLAQLERTAQIVSRTGRAQTVARSGEVVTVQPTATAVDITFTGPVTYAKGWPRMSAQFAGKAEQLAAQGGGWLRVDSADGLFWASGWAHAPLPDRTREMELLIEEAVGGLPSVHGVVLTSGGCWAPGISKTSSRTKSGSYGLERPLPMGRGRATFIVPLSSDALGGIRHWHDLYDSESGWLDWALSQAALPSVQDLLS